MQSMIILDLRDELKEFKRNLIKPVNLRETTIEEIIRIVFDVLLYGQIEDQNVPNLSGLGTFYKDYIENDNSFKYFFLEDLDKLVDKVEEKMFNLGIINLNNENHEFNYYPFKIKNHVVYLTNFID